MMKTSRRSMLRVLASPHGLFHIQEGFLFKGPQLCILECGFRELLIQEHHGGALADHFGVEKTCSMLNEHYY